MNLKDIERAAYMAAHRILMTNLSAPELACPGARRSHAVDTIAHIIEEVFEPYDSDCASRWERTANCPPDPSERFRTAEILELPRRISQ